MVASLQEIESAVRRLASTVDAPRDSLPTYGRSADFGQPYIEVDHSGYHFVVVERGRELDRRTTQDIDELLYWVFQSITFNMGCHYELKHRDPQRDSRRPLWAHQLDLLRSLNPSWASRREEEIQTILKRHPFKGD